MSDKKLCNLSRRKALGVLGACGAMPFLQDPIEVLVNGLIEGLIVDAQAATAGMPPRKYVYIALNGGPARWVFDNPLQPYAGTLAVNPAPQVKTRVNASGRLEYATTSVTRAGVTLQMPWLWTARIPTADGGTVPMVELLDNMLMIRGVNLLIDGHGPNAQKQLRPVPSGGSLNGLVADASDAPLPAVGMPGGSISAFKSKKGVGLAYSGDLYATSDPLRVLLGPFNRGTDVPAEYLGRRQAMEVAVNRALAKLGEYAQSGAPGAENLVQLRSKAEALIKQGIGDVRAEYVRLLNKYQALISRCAAAAQLSDPANPMTIPGVTDRVTPHSGLNVVGGITPQSGMHDRILRNTDLRTLISPATDTGLAAGFAVTEYLLLNGLTSTTVFGSSGTQDVYFENSSSRDTPTVIDPPRSGIITFDEHYVGSYVSFFVNSFFYRATAACIRELITQLKAKNLFNETVIQLGGEFGRNPRSNESGSDHGWMADSTSLFSGAINRPMVLGNTRIEGAEHGAGSWGRAAKVKVDGSEQELTIGHKTSTICHLLRVKPILTNNSPLIVETASGLAASVDPATQKDE